MPPLEGISGPREGPICLIGRSEQTVIHTMATASPYDTLRWLPTVLAFAFGISIFAVGAFFFAESMWLLQAGAESAGDLLGPLGLLSLLVGAATAGGAAVHLSHIRQGYALNVAPYMA